MSDIHPNAGSASLVAEYANEQGKFCLLPIIPASLFIFLIVFAFATAFCTGMHIYDDK